MSSFQEDRGYLLNCRCHLIKVVSAEYGKSIGEPEGFSFNRFCNGKTLGSIINGFGAK
jgi:hypothetical protein